MTDDSEGRGASDPRSITRPHRKLLWYYVWVAAGSLIFFPFVFAPLWAKYRTLRYRFDEEGVSMSWGILFQREIHLTYRRIQDIHVTRNLLHRWLGLSSLSLQTASGSSGAEMTIEGITRPEELRDYLYGRMRGVREETDLVEDAPSAAPPAGTVDADEILATLREIRDALRRLGPEA